MSLQMCPECKEKLLKHLQYLEWAKERKLAVYCGEITILMESICKLLRKKVPFSVEMDEMGWYISGNDEEVRQVLDLP